MLGKFHSFCECFVAVEEVVLANSLIKGALASTDVVFSGLILACENLSPAYSDTARKAMTM